MIIDKSWWWIMWDNLMEKKLDNFVLFESIYVVKIDLK